MEKDFYEDVLPLLNPDRHIAVWDKEVSEEKDLQIIRGIVEKIQEENIRMTDFLKDKDEQTAEVLLCRVLDKVLKLYFKVEDERERLRFPDLEKGFRDLKLFQITDIVLFQIRWLKFWNELKQSISFDLLQDLDYMANKYGIQYEYNDESIKGYKMAFDDRDFLIMPQYKIRASRMGMEESKGERKRGRERKDFFAYMTNDKEEHLKILHEVMKGKKGKQVALIIKIAMQSGWITKPTFRAVENEFGDVGHRSGFNKYMEDGFQFTKDEIEGAKAQLGLLS